MEKITEDRSGWMLWQGLEIETIKAEVHGHLSVLVEERLQESTEALEVAAYSGITEQLLNI